MADQRHIEIFSAGCPTCEDAIQTVTRLACPSCQIDVLDMMDATVAARARQLGIRSVPAILVDGKLAACCSGRGPDEAALRAAGIGVPLP
ncbi:MAG: thioredoxin family protein [Alphaproteobacteria bacterium]|nr:thioredoxin family protein [Alphaproteobacteria bacterium]